VLTVECLRSLARCRRPAKYAASRLLTSSLPRPSPLLAEFHPVVKKLIATGNFIVFTSPFVVIVDVNGKMFSPKGNAHRDSVFTATLQLHPKHRETKIDSLADIEKLFMGPAKEAGCPISIRDEPEPLPLSTIMSPGQMARFFGTAKLPASAALKAGTLWTPPGTCAKRYLDQGIEQNAEFKRAKRQQEESSSQDSTASSSSSYA